MRELKERFNGGEETDIEVILIEVEEQPIERPKHNQEESYSGKNTELRSVQPYDKVSDHSRGRDIRNTGRIQRYGHGARLQDVQGECGGDTAERHKGIVRQRLSRRERISEKRGYTNQSDEKARIKRGGEGVEHGALKEANSY